MLLLLEGLVFENYEAMTEHGKKSTDDDYIPPRRLVRRIARGSILSSMFGHNVMETMAYKVSELATDTRFISHDGDMKKQHMLRPSALND
jgi:hypothetical protein